MKTLKEYITESGFSKKQLETEAKSKVLSWAREYDWDYDKVSLKMEQWFDNGQASYYFDKRRFNNKEASIFTDCMHYVLKDKTSFEGFTKEYNNNLNEAV